MSDGTKIRGWTPDQAEDLRIKLYNFFKKTPSRDFAIQSGPILEEYKARLAQLSEYPKPHTAKRDIDQLDAIHTLLLDLASKVEDMGPWGLRAIDDSWWVDAANTAASIVDDEPKTSKEGMEILRAPDTWDWFFNYPNFDMPTAIDTMLETVDWARKSSVPFLAEKYPGGHDIMRRELALFLSTGFAKVYRLTFKKEIGKTVGGAFSTAIVQGLKAAGVEAPDDQRRLIGKTQDFLKRHKDCHESKVCKYQSWICNVIEGAPRS